MTTRGKLSGSGLATLAIHAIDNVEATGPIPSLSIPPRPRKRGEPWNLLVNLFS